MKPADVAVEYSFIEIAEESANLAGLVLLSSMIFIFGFVLVLLMVKQHNDVNWNRRHAKFVPGLCGRCRYQLLRYQQTCPECGVSTSGTMWELPRRSWFGTLPGPATRTGICVIFGLCFGLAIGFVTQCFVMVTLGVMADAADASAFVQEVDSRRLSGDIRYSRAATERGEFGGGRDWVWTWHVNGGYSLRQEP